MLAACDFGNKQAKNLVIGSVWAPLTAEGLFAFEREVLDLRIVRKCWSNLQWKKSQSSDAICNTYLDFIELFIKSHLNFSCIVVSQERFYELGKHIIAKDLIEAVPTFTYLLISRRMKNYCRPSSKLTVLLDREAQHREAIPDIRQKTDTYTLLHNKLTPNLQIHHIQQCDSHISSVLQLCDILTGAVSYAINQVSANDCCQRMASKLEQDLGIRLGQATPVTYDKLNIWQWSPRMAI